MWYNSLTRRWPKMDRFSSAKKASILGIIGNLFLFIIKTIITFITNSQAMLADALNSATDILSSIMTYIGNKISSKQPDKDHDLGHGKAEYIYSMLISITMLLLGVKLIINTIKNLIIGNQFTFNIWLIIICLITIFTKILLFLYTNKIGKKYNNLLVLANSKDHRNDIIITTCNLISCLLSSFHIFIFDIIVGIGIGIWIVITGIKIFKESYDVLMDKTISEETKDKVKKIIKKHNEIIKFTHFNATPVGYKYQISLTIFVDGNLSTFASHQIADKLEKEINNEVPEIFLAVIHVNPAFIQDTKK